MPKVHHFVLLVTLIYVQCSLLFVCLISAVNAAWFNKLQTEHDVFPIYSNPKIRHIKQKQKVRVILKTNKP